jgi:ABC-2 type transport system permease protein
VAYAAENVAAMPVRLAVSLPVAIGAFLLLGGQHVTHDPLLLALFPLTVFSAWLITYLAMAAVGCLAFWFDSATSLFDVWLGLFGIFSGYLVPLDLYPRWVLEVSYWLPFRYMLAFPVELVTGGLTRSQALAQLAAQWAFVLVLLAVAAGMWRLGTRRFSATGG